MNKMFSLIKATMSNNMSLFKIKTKNSSKRTKVILPIFLTAMLFFVFWSYADMFMEEFSKVNMEYVVLPMFILLTSIVTLIEGIYKSGNLLFNCKDDDLLLSLPIKKSTVLFIRILKFYVFELIYNSVFLLPAIVGYAMRVDVNPMYYLVSFIALLLLPIIPIVVSCIIGGIISAFSSKFKLKNVAQIVITMVFLIFIFIISFNMDTFIEGLAENASSINEIITGIYYPAGAYVNMILNFEWLELAVFVIIHIALLVGMIFALSKVYYKINTNIKAVKTGHKNSSYKISANKPVIALVKKELKRFISSPVFVTNAGFGVVLFIVGCVLISINYDGVVASLATEGFPLEVEIIKSYLPAVLFGFLCFSTLMTSITSSMISLEGKSFGILKSIPIKPAMIINSKVITAISIMLPFLLIGDLIIFVRFGFSLYNIIVLLIATVVLALVSETIGILVNLKYPKMDADNDTEVVKQSMSSMIAVFIGMILTGVSIAGIIGALSIGISVDLTILIGTCLFALIYAGLLVYMNKVSVKEFNEIDG